MLHLLFLKVVELISTAISDFMEAEFIGERDNQGNPVPSETITMQDWNEKNFLAAGKSSTFYHHYLVYFPLCLVLETWMQYEEFLTS